MLAAVEDIDSDSFGLSKSPDGVKAMRNRQLSATLEHGAYGALNLCVCFGVHLKKGGYVVHGGRRSGSQR